MQQVKQIDLGLIDYKEAWDYQEQLFDTIVRVKLDNNNLPKDLIKSTPNYIIFCEHPNVYTLGKSGNQDHLLINDEQLKQNNAAFYRINRGGDITFHGPGQMVVYPILDLDNFYTDIHKYLRLLEESIIRTLSEYDIIGARSEGETGVWVDIENPYQARKICAMGVRTSRWVTMHGLALNVNVDLSYFNNIIPCGIQNKKVTSLERELGNKTEIEEVKEKFIKHFSDLFKCNIVK